MLPGKRFLVRRLVPAPQRIRLTRRLAVQLPLAVAGLLGSYAERFDGFWRQLRWHGRGTPRQTRHEHQQQCGPGRILRQLSCLRLSLELHSSLLPVRSPRLPATETHAAAHQLRLPQRDRVDRACDHNAVHPTVGLLARQLAGRIQPVVSDERFDGIEDADHTLGDLRDAAEVRLEAYRHGVRVRVVAEGERRSEYGVVALTPVLPSGDHFAALDGHARRCQSWEVGVSAGSV